MCNISFESLPRVVQELTQEVSQLKQLIIANEAKTPVVPQEQFLNIQEASCFLNLSIATIYSKVSKGEIPYYKPNKHLLFSRSELVNYLKLGKRKTNAEIEQEATAYIVNTKKGLNYGK
jgi:excisionase family DNA binding protein